LIVAKRKKRSERYQIEIIRTKEEKKYTHIANEKRKKNSKK
jgi:hypothetical protein